MFCASIFSAGGENVPSPPSVPPPTSGGGSGSGESYTLRVIGGQPGSIQVTEGQQILITANPPSIGKTFGEWRGNTEFVSNKFSSSSTVTMPARSVTLISSYVVGTAQERFTLSVSNGSGSGSYPSDTAVEIQAVQPSGAGEFIKWSGSGVGYLSDEFNPNTILIMPEQNLSLVAEFDGQGDKVLLTVNKGSGSGFFDIGNVTTITANPPLAGFSFDQWTGQTNNISDVFSSETQIFMDDTTTVSASYKATTERRFTLNVINGSGDGSYLEGQRIPVSAVRSNDPAQVFSRWSGDSQFLNNATSSNTTFTMPPRDAEIAATYRGGQSFNLTVRGGEGSGRYPAGSAVPIKAVPGHWSVDFNSWQGDVSAVQNSNSQSTTITMPNRDIEVNASFRRQSRDSQIRALFATDWFVMKDLWGTRKDDFEKWRAAGINTVYAPLDLHVNCSGTRPHVEAGRNETSVRDVVVRNINTVYDQGFNVMVVPANTWALRKDLARCMGTYGRRSVDENQFFSDSRYLNNEKAAWNDLRNKVGNKIHSVVLALEPTDGRAKSWMEQFANHIRSTGFGGAIYSNGIGNAYWGGNSQVRKAKSLNSIGEYLSSGEDLRNTDGFGSSDSGQKLRVDNSRTANLVSQITSNPGRDGYILWFDDYRGSSAGSFPLNDVHWKHIKYVQDPNGGSTPNIPDVPADNGNQEPYRSSPHSIPGKIEAEEFDKGGQGTAYYDTTPGNAEGAFRNNVDVDINERQGQNVVGYTVAGEWLEYTVQVNESAKYFVTLQYGSPNNTRVALSVDSPNNDVAVWDLVASGGWDSRIPSPSKEINLSRGEHVIRLKILNSSSGGTALDINYLDFSKENNNGGGGTVGGVQPGCIGSDQSKQNLIKPVADNNRPMVILLSCEHFGYATEAQIIYGGGTEKGNDSTYYETPHNGRRVHYRFQHKGSHYGSGTFRAKIRGQWYRYQGPFGNRVEFFPLTRE